MNKTVKSIYTDNKYLHILHFRNIDIILNLLINKEFRLSKVNNIKADIIPYSKEYAPQIRSWIDSIEIYKYVCLGKEFPPPDNIVNTWQRKEVASYLLFSNSKPVVYGELWNRPNEMALEIAHLIVDPARRSMGYGTKMLELLYNRGAARKDVAKVIANIYNDNSVALGCFLKAGFELVGKTSYAQGLRMVRMIR